MKDLRIKWSGAIFFLIVPIIIWLLLSYQFDSSLDKLAEYLMDNNKKISSIFGESYIWKLKKKTISHIEGKHYVYTYIVFGSNREDLVFIVLPSEKKKNYKIIYYENKEKIVLAKGSQNIIK